MKRTVLSMAEENFDFSVHDGNVTFSTERIEFVFVDDKERNGSFNLYVQSDSPILGVCHSNNPRMKVLNPQFRGFEATIEFVFDPKGMEADDYSKGEFILLTNKGEYTLPFICIRETDYINSTLGHIKNLFHFANLARTNWNEAVNVFYSNDFVSIISGNDAQYKSLYRGLSENVLNEQNIDEFLVAIKKKDRITYTLETPEINIVNPNGEATKKITLKKNTWGYVNVDIKTEGNFVFVPCNHFSGDDFENDKLDIEVKIIPEFLKKGRNYGAVIIDTPQKTYRVNVIVDNDRQDITKHENFMFKQALDSLMRLYIEFSLDRISEDEFFKKSLAIAEKIKGTNEHQIIAALFKAQIFIISKRERDAFRILESVDAIIENEKLSDETYGYYFYITSLLSKDSDIVNRSLKKIRKFYSKDMGNSILSWLIIYLTEDFYQRKEKKLEFLIEQYRCGNNSPLLYIEGLSIFNENPSLLMKLEDYEESVLRFKTERI